MRLAVLVADDRLAVGADVLTTGLEVARVRKVIVADAKLLATEGAQLLKDDALEAVRAVGVFVFDDGFVQGTAVFAVGVRATALGAHGAIEDVVQAQLAGVRVEIAAVGGVTGHVALGVAPTAGVRSDLVLTVDAKKIVAAQRGEGDQEAGRRGHGTVVARSADVAVGAASESQCGQSGECLGSGQ
jgi:hypothetical protein